MRGAFPRAARWSARPSTLRRATSTAASTPSKATGASPSARRAKALTRRRPTPPSSASRSALPRIKRSPSTSASTPRPRPCCWPSGAAARRRRRRRRSRRRARAEASRRRRPPRPAARSAAPAAHAQERSFPELPGPSRERRLGDCARDGRHRRRPRPPARHCVPGALHAPARPLGVARRRCAEHRADLARRKAGRGPGRGRGAAGDGGRHARLQAGPLPVYFRGRVCAAADRRPGPRALHRRLVQCCVWFLRCPESGGMRACSKAAFRGADPRKIVVRTPLRDPKHRSVGTFDAEEALDDVLKVAGAAAGGFGVGLVSVALVPKDVRNRDAVAPDEGTTHTRFHVCTVLERAGHTLHTRLSALDVSTRVCAAAQTRALRPWPPPFGGSRSTRASSTSTASPRTTWTSTTPPEPRRCSSTRRSTARTRWWPSISTRWGRAGWCPRPLAAKPPSPNRGGASSGRTMRSSCPA